MTTNDRLPQYETVTPISEAIDRSLRKLSNVVRVALISLGVGAILVLLALLLKDSMAVRYWLNAIGLALISLTGVLLYLAIAPLLHAQGSIQRNAKLIDGLQHTAIEMTDIATSLNSLLLKQATHVAEIVQDIRSKLPGTLLDKLADGAGLATLDRLSSNVVTLTHSSNNAIGDMRTAIVQSNPANLNKCLSEIASVRDAIKSLV